MVRRLLDGGNSYYIDDIRRAKELAPRRIHYVSSVRRRATTEPTQRNL
jgi:6-phosphogluconate dehydrogenase (decarboxylating)